MPLSTNSSATRAFALPKLLLLMVSVLLLSRGVTAQLMLHDIASSATTVLGDDAVVCPAAHPEGFSVQYVHSENDTRAKFFVNGRWVRTERSPPFYIAGDASGQPRAWLDYPASAVVRCVVSPGRVIVSTRISFQCTPTITPSPSPSPSSAPFSEPSPSPATKPVAIPATLHFVTTGRAPPQEVAMRTGDVFCAREIFGRSTFSVRCTGATNAKWAEFFVDGVLLRRMRKQPFVVAGLARGRVRAWKTAPTGYFKIECRLDDLSVVAVKQVRVECGVKTNAPPTTVGGGTVADDTAVTTTIAPTTTTVDPTTTTVDPTTTTVDPTTTTVDPTTTTVMAPTTTTTDPTTAITADMDEKTRLGCIIIDAKTATPSAGWAEVSSGLSFKGSNTAKGITRGGKSPLLYTFTPSHTSRHAVVLDMTTSGGSDFNDVWVQLDPDGFQLMRRGAKRFATGWIKAYHNHNGRSLITSSVDNNAHSISSGAILREGVQYTIGVSGRSNMVTLHRILLFPCADTGCQRGGWRDSQNVCIPGSI